MEITQLLTCTRHSPLPDQVHFVGHEDDGAVSAHLHLQVAQQEGRHVKRRSVSDRKHDDVRVVLRVIFLRHL